MSLPVVLSPAELDVALLAGAGLSNEAIARRRGTAKRTIASQMACIFAKLRIGTRRALFTIDELRAVGIAPQSRPTVRWEALRRRERQVLALATQGASLKVIAADLGVSASTVSEALRTARVRLGFPSVADLLREYDANESRSG